MIEFRGLSEQSILGMDGKHVKDIMSKLKEYKKNNPQQCLLMSRK